jgi:hypothetical protein
VFDINETVSHVQCSVPGCAANADYRLHISDTFPDSYGDYDEPSHHCPFLCHPHAVANEAGAEGIRARGARVTYPHVKTGGTGYVRYQSLATGDFLPLGDFEYPALKERRARTKRK